MTVTIFNDGDWLVMNEYHLPLTVVHARWSLEDGRLAECWTHSFK